MKYRYEKNTNLILCRKEKKCKSLNLDYKGGSHPKRGRQNLDTLLK